MDETTREQMHGECRDLRTEAEMPLSIDPVLALLLARWVAAHAWVQTLGSTYSVVNLSRGGSMYDVNQAARTELSRRRTALEQYQPPTRSDR